MACPMKCTERGLRWHRWCWRDIRFRCTFTAGVGRTPTGGSSAGAQSRPRFQQANAGRRLYTDYPRLSREEGTTAVDKPEEGIGQRASPVTATGGWQKICSKWIMNFLIPRDAISQFSTMRMHSIVACLPACMPACLPPCLPASLPPCCLPPCFPASCLPAASQPTIFPAASCVCLTHTDIILRPID
jgi:hypothetical protein